MERSLSCVSLTLLPFYSIRRRGSKYCRRTGRIITVQEVVFELFMSLFAPTIVVVDKVFRPYCSLVVHGICLNIIYTVSSYVGKAYRWYKQSASIQKTSTSSSSSSVIRSKKRKKKKRNSGSNGSRNNNSSTTNHEKGPHDSRSTNIGETAVRSTTNKNVQKGGTKTEKANQNSLSFRQEKKNS